MSRLSTIIKLKLEVDVLASCLIYAWAFLEYVNFIFWVCSFSKMLLSVKFTEDKVLV